MSQCCASCLLHQTGDAERVWHRGTYERVQNLRPYRKGRGGRTKERTVGSGIPASRGITHLGPRKAESRASFCCGTASEDALPHGGRHRRPAQRGPTVRRQEPSPIKGCGTPEAIAPPRTVSRVQSYVATDSEDLLRPPIGDGRNNVLRRGRCARPLCEAVPTPSSYSGSIEEQKGKGRRSESASRGCPRSVRRRRGEGFLFT
jgi:hypothetical protein